jgi:hypothetical protein
MRVIDVMRIRLERSGGISGALAAGWDAFDLIQRVAAGYADGVPEAYAAFMLATAAACEGRDALGFAPSMPHDPGEVIECPDFTQPETMRRRISSPTSRRHWAAVCGELRVRQRSPETGRRASAGRTPLRRSAGCWPGADRWLRSRSAIS